MYASAILSFVRQFPRECLAALVLILLAAGTALVPPMLLGRFIDALGGGQFVILRARLRGCSRAGRTR